MLDFVQRGEVVEVDAQTSDGAWLRMARVYKDGCGGWVLVDGTPLGYGILLEAVAEGATVTEPSPPISTPPSKPPTPVPPVQPPPPPPPPETRSHAPSQHSDEPTGADHGAAKVGRHGGDPVPESFVDLEALVRRAGLPPTYVARLSAAGLPQSLLRQGMSTEVTEAAKRAKLPVGHRLKLALVYKEDA